jgi:hypothetical protein
LKNKKTEEEDITQSFDVKNKIPGLHYAFFSFRCQVQARKSNKSRLKLYHTLSDINPSHIRNCSSYNPLPHFNVLSQFHNMIRHMELDELKIIN